MSIFLSIRLGSFQKPFLILVTRLHLASTFLLVAILITKGLISNDLDLQRGNRLLFCFGTILASWFGGLIMNIGSLNLEEWITETTGEKDLQYLSFLAWALLILKLFPCFSHRYLIQVQHPCIPAIGTSPSPRLCPSGADRAVVTPQHLRDSCGNAN